MDRRFAVAALAVALAACAEDPGDPGAEEITACAVQAVSWLPSPDEASIPLGLTCLPRSVDLDAAAAGTQAECSVFTDDEVLVACDATDGLARPCYRFAPELDVGCVDDGRAIVMDCGTQVTAARWVTVECVTACS
jgi:hypothetical protein